VVLDGRGVSQLAVQPPVVVPVDVLDRGDLQVVQAAPGRSFGIGIGIGMQVQVSNRAELLR
jgi:hypothetical protein